MKTFWTDFHAIAWACLIAGLLFFMFSTCPTPTCAAKSIPGKGNDPCFEARVDTLVWTLNYLETNSPKADRAGLQLFLDRMRESGEWPQPPALQRK